jgi:hypothetical protein
MSEPGQGHVGEFLAGLPGLADSPVDRCRLLRVPARVGLSVRGLVYPGCYTELLAGA